MVTLSDEITQSIEVQGEKVTFTFRQPTKEELNKFMGSRYPVDRKNRPSDNSLKARVDFFDLLIIGIDNLADKTGTIGPDRKDAVPANWKAAVIFQAFEDVQAIDAGN